MRSIDKTVQRLPPELQQEALDFIDFLVECQTSKKRKRLKLDWAGGLKEYKGRYTSLDLQKMASEWWGN